MKFWRHVRALWPTLPLLPVLPFWLWAAFWRSRHELRWEHVALAVAASTCAYGTRWTRRLYVELLPLGLTGVLYDAMKLVDKLGVAPGTVHACDVRERELAWFGVTSDHARMTLQEWFLIHSSPVLDVLSAVPYGTFLLFTLLYAVFLFSKDSVATRRFTWGFLVVNLAGFITYHLYPAAPPWYIHAHGCSIDTSVGPSEGPHLANVDRLIGTPYFASMYARSSDVFGAIPSLHAAYPLLMVLIGFPLQRVGGRLVLVGFYLWTCFAAIYLDHHWVIDVLSGSAYALVVALAVHRFIPRRSLDGAHHPQTEA
jgi:membrane-associated phospholipid phosphatase